ncbi:hypothetical protein [Gimesia chilikensis]|uniref:hypothetical protein n=1 Tax=Gimesia chilikensis TaxID=2605989 RepID=UPI003A8FDA16
MKYLPVVLCLLFVGCEQKPKTPEEIAFDAANKKIASSRGGIAYGATEEEKELAQKFSTSMKTLEKEFFTGGKEDRIISLTKEEFLTYCKINEDSILFLVHVPQLKEYKGEVRDALNQLSWYVANEVTKDIKPDDTELELAVGLRGAIFYGGSSVGLRGEEAEYENARSISDKQFFKYFKSLKTDEQIN